MTRVGLIDDFFDFLQTSCLLYVIVDVLNYVVARSYSHLSHRVVFFGALIFLRHLTTSQYSRSFLGTSLMAVKLWFCHWSCTFCYWFIHSVLHLSYAIQMLESFHLVFRSFRCRLNLLEFCFSPVDFRPSLTELSPNLTLMNSSIQRYWIEPSLSFTLLISSIINYNSMWSCYLMGFWGFGVLGVLGV